jgi:hypothetical protein
MKLGEVTASPLVVANELGENVGRSWKWIRSHRAKIRLKGLELAVLYWLDMFLE